MRKHQRVFRFGVVGCKLYDFVKELLKEGGIRAVFDRLAEVIDQLADDAAIRRDDAELVGAKRSFECETLLISITQGAIAKAATRQKAKKGLR